MLRQEWLGSVRASYRQHVDAVHGVETLVEAPHGAFRGTLLETPDFDALVSRRHREIREPCKRRVPAGAAFRRADLDQHQQLGVPILEADEDGAVTVGARLLESEDWLGPELQPAARRSPRIVEAENSRAMLRICTIRKPGVIAGSGAPGIGKGSIPGPLGDQNNLPLRVAVIGSKESECISWMT